MCEYHACSVTITSSTSYQVEEEVEEAGVQGGGEILGRGLDGESLIPASGQ